MPEPRTIAVEGDDLRWVDLRSPASAHAVKVKVAHPADVAGDRFQRQKRRTDRIDASKIADCLRCDFLPECATWHQPRSAIGATHPALS